MVLMSSCDNFFGDKTTLEFITPPDTSARQVSYVPVFPFITQGLVRPTQVISGNDQLLYVVDEDAHKIVSFDEAGRRLGELFIPGVKAVAQDRTLDLLAIGYDSVDIAPGAETNWVRLATIYRINLKQAVYGLSQARITDTISHPYYFSRNVAITPDLEDVTFQSISVLPDNRFLVVRNGPGSDIFTGPNDAVLLFGQDDRLISPIQITGDGGATFPDFFKSPFAVAATPPSGFTISPTDRQDFIVTTLNTDPDSVLRVRYVEVNSSGDVPSYNIRQLAGSGGATARGAIYQPGRFVRPKGVTFANDENGYIFVTDEAKDSLYQFTPEGLEGVRLRASQTNPNYNKVSFGGRGNGPYQFNQPRGIAYRNRNLYVADAGNGRICRYRLTIDFE